MISCHWLSAGQFTLIHWDLLQRVCLIYQKWRPSHTAGPHTLWPTCQWMPWPGAELVGRSDGKIELSSPCSCLRRLWATQQGYLSISCPLTPSGRSPASSFVRPIRLSCLGSLTKTTKQSRLLRCWDGVEAWSDGEKG